MIGSGTSTHGSDVEVHEVDLAELRLEFADLDEQIGRKARERQEALLELDLFVR